MDEAGPCLLTVVLQWEVPPCLALSSAPILNGAAHGQKSLLCIGGGYHQTAWHDGGWRLVVRKGPCKSDELKMFSEQRHCGRPEQREWDSVLMWQFCAVATTLIQL